MKTDILRKIFMVWILVVAVAMGGREVKVDPDGNPVPSLGGECDCFAGWSCYCDNRLRDPSPTIEALFYEKDAGLKMIYSECMHDIYFGNGVWNDEGGAWASVIQLFGEFSRLDRYDPKVHHFGLAYNIGTPASAGASGALDDIIETFWQLRESGQVKTGFYNAIYLIGRYAAGSNLVAQMGLTDFVNYINRRLPDIRAELSANYESMFGKYQNISFKNGHRVMLVAHSQGNLFGNYMHEQKFNWQKNYFKMISVATPADHVAGDGPYVTVQWDMVITFVPGALRYNEPGSGHEFVATYLADRAGDALSRYMMFADRRLSELETQWKVVARIGEDTCGYRVALEHKYKASSQIENMVPVYPFDLEDGKLYQIQNKFVMGHCGGNNVKIYTCDNTKPSLCYELNGTKDAIESIDKDLNQKPGFEVSVNDGAFIAYDKDTFKTIAHDETEEFPYQNYTFRVKFDDNMTDIWTAAKHTTQQWQNSCGDILRIGNDADILSPIHRGINMCIEMNDGTRTCFDIYDIPPPT